MLTVLGLALAMMWIRRNMQRGIASFESAAVGRKVELTPAGSLVGVILATLLIVASLPLVRSERELRARSAATRVFLWDVMDKLPTPRNLLFVRDERRGPRNMVTNIADPAHARTLLAHDLGNEDVRLGKLMRDRTAYLIDLGAKTLIMLPPLPDSAAR